MIFTQQYVWNSVKRIAPKYTLDPYLIMAIAEQECEKDKSGDYDASVCRLEQGFYRRYVKNGNRATTTEVLLSASYGIFQMMGMSLLEAGWLEGADNPLEVAAALNLYCTDLDSMTRSACVWFTKKLELSEGKTGQALLKWNGGGNLEYDNQVVGRISKLKANLK